LSLKLIKTPFCSLFDKNQRLSEVCKNFCF
jgi:hypothetical protein